MTYEASLAALNDDPTVKCLSIPSFDNFGIHETRACDRIVSVKEAINRSPKHEPARSWSPLRGLKFKDPDEMEAELARRKEIMRQQRRERNRSGFSSRSRGSSPSDRGSSPGDGGHYGGSSKHSSKHSSPKDRDSPS